MNRACGAQVQGPMGSEGPVMFSITYVRVVIVGPLWQEALRRIHEKLLFISLVKKEILKLSFSFFKRHYTETQNVHKETQDKHEETQNDHKETQDKHRDAKCPQRDAKCPQRDARQTQRCKTKTKRHKIIKSK